MGRGLPKENELEALLESQLVQDGYRQGENGNYDKNFAIDKKYFLEFLEITQFEILKKYKELKGKNWEQDLFFKLSSELKNRGVIDVIRRGFQDIMMIETFNLFFAKPNSNLNPTAKSLYEKNIFSITRQLKYSLKNSNSLDVVLFLNGIPIVTLELKNEYTGQNVFDAIKQYKKDRDPKEQIFKPFERALVHFAVDTNEVFMTTQLKGVPTFFLPFNKGNNGGKGNPTSESGIKTNYLWNEILMRDSLSDIIKRFYFVQEKDKKKTPIFPRYHQLDVIRKIDKDIFENGAFNNYLIQHSAGSGKTNSIAWLSHRLANIHSKKDQNIFDSVIVITDRKVLDRQLQDAIYQLEHKSGVVEKIDDGKHSKDLAKAIANGSKIIITTIQKFPFALAQMDILDKNKKFAVIIDEAHSSTSGKSMNALKDTLAGKTLEEAAKQESQIEERTAEDEIVDLLKARTEKGRIIFFAFTATPKHKTLEMFGKKGADGKPEAFHLYSMKQAIQEGFILDVLKNYTTYEIYYKVSKHVEENKEFKVSEATKSINRYVSLHEHNIRQKVEIIVEDFQNHRRNMIDGNAKGMIVTSSRLHAVKFKQEMDKYIAEKKYIINTLVAFSGTVNYEGIEYTEIEMNNGISEKELSLKFSENKDNKFLIVAEKYQTGFDEPKLCAMYVDKILDGVAAVQTLSRLNRTMPCKNTTFILDFTNSVEEIQESFAPYYEDTKIDKPTDPNVLLDMYYKMHKTGIFIDDEITRFTAIYLKIKKSSSEIETMNHLTDLGVERFLKLDEDAREDFRVTAIKYIRFYNFLLQIFSILNPELYKAQTYLCGLIKKIPKDLKTVEIIEGLVELDSFRIKQIAGEGAEGVNISSIQDVLEEEKTLIGMTTGTAVRVTEEQIESLKNIIEKINEKHGLGLSQNDKLSFEQLENDLKTDATLKEMAQTNTKEDFMTGIEREFLKVLINRIAKNNGLFTQIMSDASLKRTILNAVGSNLYDEFTK